MAAQPNRPAQRSSSLGRQHGITGLNRADLIEFITALQSVLKSDEAEQSSSYEKRLARLKGDFCKRHAEAVAAGNEPGAVVDLSLADIKAPEVGSRPGLNELHHHDAWPMTGLPVHNDFCGAADWAASPSRSAGRRLGFPP